MAPALLDGTHNVSSCLTLTHLETGFAKLYTCDHLFAINTDTRVADATYEAFAYSTNVNKISIFV
jgi:hypothetical protein